MKILPIIGVCILAVIGQLAEALAPSFGFIPKSFPRSTLAFDVYYEQMAIGQILEPLVTSDQYGNVAPALAMKWEILDKGKHLRFHLRPHAVFSNGKEIVAKDVVSTLTRHWKSVHAGLSRDHFCQFVGIPGPPRVFADSGTIQRSVFFCT
jgi:ABC-type transport system substrate-binding protein